jgi:hypothetical protein
MMVAEEQPMLYESNDSDSSNDESSDQDIPESSEKDANDVENELPKKFDLSKINQRMEEGPPSSSDEDEDDENDEYHESKSSAEEQSDQEDNKNAGVGWADAMAKVLNIGKNSKSDKPLLLRAAKKDVNEVKDTESKSLEKPSVRRAKKKEIAEMGRKKPDIVKDRIREKRLAKLATRGVVQLFNAVRDQQKTLKTSLNKAGLSTTKRDKVYKNLDKDAFLDVLSGKKNKLTSSNGASQNGHKKVPKTEVKEEDDDGTWSVLKDNFMMGAKMRDWDKESDSDDEMK